MIVIGGAPGPELHLLEVGAAIQRMVVTCGDGVRRDLALGLAEGAPVGARSGYVGSVVGRYANRIAHGRFVLDGVERVLPVNDRGHHLHGGPDGFHARTWAVVQRSATSVTFELVSPDGDAGYPGELTARASYRVTGEGAALDLMATTTAPTLVNLTSHVYLDLHGEGTIDDHLLQVPAARYLPVDDCGIPIGEPVVVDGTRHDLRAPTRLGDAGALDHDFLPDGSGFRQVAVLDAPATGTRMELWSDQPGLQVYTGDGFDGSVDGRTGTPVRARAGIALEPQLHPDTPNRGDWPSAVLRPGASYRSRVEWRFARLDRSNSMGS